MKKFLLLSCLSLLGCHSQETKNPTPDIPPETKPGTPTAFSSRKLCDLPKLAEKSGVCMSGDRLYIIQDSDRPSDVTVVDLSCKKLGTIKLKVPNNDFEAVACSKGKVYVGDIGDGADDKTIYSFDEPSDPNATITPIAQKFKSDLNLEGMAVDARGDLFFASKDEGKQSILKLEGSSLKELFTLPFKTPLGDLAISPSEKKFLIAEDETNRFFQCDWSGLCETITTPFTGDHEAVTYIDENAFVFMSEDENGLYIGEWKTTPTPTPKPQDPPQAHKWYVPSPSMRYQILDEDDGEDFVSQVKNGTQIVTIECVTDDYKDLAKKISALHAKGVKVICYHSLSYEPWRNDIKNFPSAAKGSKMKGWNEWWADWRPTSPAHIFWDARYREFSKAGADCVEDDNMVDSKDNETGFPLTQADSAASAKRRAEFAHSVNLCHISKNNPSMSADYAKVSDGVFIEESAEYNERDKYLPWKAAGKFGAMIEYSKSNCKPYPGFSVQYHPGGDYFDGKDYKICD